MKRWRLGAGVLALLLAAGLASGAWMKHFHGELENMALSGWEAARNGDRAGAAEHFRMLRSRWEKGRTLTAVLTDHGALEEVDALLEQLVVSESGQFLEEKGLQVAAILRTLAGSQRLSLENLL